MSSLRRYPVRRASSAPATGSVFYRHLMENISIPARSNHEIWYAGEKAKLERPDEFAFRGNIPKGQVLELKTLSGKPVPREANLQMMIQEDRGSVLYEFTGSEGPVLVSDLAPSARERLGIPEHARDKDKVFNPNFVEYEELDEPTRLSNELAALALPKGISGFFGGVKGKTIYSELDVLRFLNTCFEDLSSAEMMHVMHGNHMAWAVLAYVRSKGDVSGDVASEFHAQNPTDYYVKDLGTLLPAMFFALSQLGQDPVVYHDKLDVEVWGARDAAEYMRQYMPK